MFFADINSKNVVLIIRITDKCSASCRNCKEPFLQEASITNVNNLNFIIQFINKNFSKDFKIAYLGYDLLNNKYRNIIMRIKDETKGFLNYRIQLGFNDIFNNIDLLKELENLGINFGIQKTIKSQEDLYNLLKLLNKIEKFNLDIDSLFIIEKKYIGVFKILKEKYKFYNDYINVGNSEISFSIEDFSKPDIMPDCYSYNNFYFKNEKIYIKNHIEITLDGIIKFHGNTYCNKAIKGVSTIYKRQGDIYNDFIKLKNYLYKFENMDKSLRCKKCLSSPYYKI